MNEKSWNPFKARFFSAYAFFSRAMLIIFIFLVLHLFGLRQYTSFITGTTSGGINDILGMTYFIMYALSVFFAPILIIAAVFMSVLARFAGADD